MNTIMLGVIRMAKRSRIWNKTSYERRVKSGRGIGEGPSYQPWISVHDFSSRGTINRVKGWKTGRIHHFMSNNELNYFFLLEWADEVIDIREQYPLEVSLTLEISATAGIRHPRDSQNGFPYVLTSDFLITTANGLKARTIKMSCELDNPRVLEKLEIERRYWAEHDVDWGLVTEKEINRQKAKNIEWLHSARILSGLPYESMPIVAMLTEIALFYQDTDNSVLDICNHIDSVYAVSPGTGLTLFKHLVANKQLPFDINKRPDLAKRRAAQPKLHVYGRQIAI